MGYNIELLIIERSVISAFHPKIGIQVGKHPSICILLKGIFNQRPPQARDTFVWGVNVVLEEGRSNTVRSPIPKIRED